MIYRRKLANHSAGFTIVEIMVATAITGILIVLIMTFLVNAMVTNTVSSARADLLREVQLTLDNVGRDIRLSAEADENNRWEDPNAPGAPADELSWESTASTLVLATAALDSSTNILFSDPLNYVSSKNNNIYFVNDGTLYKRTLADPIAGNAAETTCPVNPSDTCTDDRVLAQDVETFSVRYFNDQNEEVAPTLARSIELTLGIRKEKYGRVIEAEFATRTVFRNE